jgi:hypothetical protein
MKAMHDRIPVLAGFLILSFCVAPAFAGTHPHDRNGFMIGFGVGGGSVGIKNGDGREGSVTGNFRIGYALRPDLVLAFEGNAWSKTFSTDQGDLTWTFSTGTASVTCFPQNMGFFLRGGIGFGTANVELERNNVKISADDTGLGLLAAAGYEWRLTQKFALGPQVEFSYQNEGGDVESSNIIAGGLNFNWYW